MNSQNGTPLSSAASTRPPKRLVSLVPSITASLYDLGLTDRVVGVTDFCPQPKGKANPLPTLGGTRNLSIEKILALGPDLVLANQEENEREAVEQLQAAGLNVWITFPRSIDQAIEMLWALLRIAPSNSQATNKLLLLERSLEWTRRSVEDLPAIPVFYPIWVDRHGGTPWFMTIHKDTYAHNVLEVCGARNIFAERERRYPLEADLGLCEPEDPGDRDRRYPRVTTEEVRARAPELILLPDEPFTFSPEHVDQVQALLSDTPAVQAGNIQNIDGRLVHWHGTTLARALAELPQVIQRT
jgi:iron complex transport system substrate-binding protein